MDKSSREPKLFISYAREDEERARRLYNDLSQWGASVWFDKEALLPGQGWERSVSLAIEQSDYVIALLSSHSVNKRGYVQKELRTALSLLDNFPEGQIYVIPARLEECQPTHVKLRSLHWVDLFPSWDEGVRRITLAMEISGKFRLGQTYFARQSAGQSRVGRRLQFKIPEPAASRLDELAKTSGVSQAEIMRQALRLYDFLVESHDRGDKLLIERKKGDRSETIQVTWPSS